MSRLAPFVDAAVSIDRTAWPNLFISYYTYGSAIGLGARPVAARRTDGTRDARHLHAGAVADLRQAGAEGAGLRGHAVHARRPQGDAGAGVRATRTSRRTSSRATSRATSWRTTRSCWRARAWWRASGRRARRGWATRSCSRAAAPCACRASCPSSRRSTRPAWRSRTRIVSLGGVDLASQGAMDGVAGTAQAGRRGADPLRAAQRRDRERHHDARRGPAHRDRHRWRRPAAR